MWESAARPRSLAGARIGPTVRRGWRPFGAVRPGLLHPSPRRRPRHPARPVPRPVGSGFLDAGLSRMVWIGLKAAGTLSGLGDEVARVWTG